MLVPCPKQVKLGVVALLARVPNNLGVQDMRNRIALWSIVAATSLGFGTAASAASALDYLMGSIIQTNGWTVEECPGRLWAYFNTDSEFKAALKSLTPDERSDVRESINEYCEEFGL